MELVDPPYLQQLKQSLIARGAAVPAGTTLGDFIEAATALGFKESDPLGSIEYGISQRGSGYVMRQDDDIIEI